MISGEGFTAFTTRIQPKRPAGLAQTSHFPALFLFFLRRPCSRPFHSLEMPRPRPTHLNGTEPADSRTRESGLPRRREAWLQASPLSRLPFLIRIVHVQGMRRARSWRLRVSWTRCLAQEPKHHVSLPMVRGERPYWLTLRRRIPLPRADDLPPRFVRAVPCPVVPSAGTVFPALATVRIFPLARNIRLTNLPKGPHSAV